MDLSLLSFRRWGILVTAVVFGVALSRISNLDASIGIGIGIDIAPSHTKKKGR